MKKFLPILLALLLLSATPIRAEFELDCSNPVTLAPFSGNAAACETINTLFQNNPNGDGPWWNQNPQQFAKKVTGGDQNEIFGERYTFAQINWIINSIATMLNPASGIDNPQKFFEFINAVREILQKPETGQVPTLQDYAKLGPAGLLAGGMATLYSHPPASGIGEAKYMAGKLFDYTTGTQPAYAQGYGFTGLGGQAGAKSAVKSLWTASRNMAYLIMIILLIASGFLIMFRVKINPQTVVSLQTMIPKLIITMLLVTFSFAIAGLVIDLIYVVIAAFAGMLAINGAIINNSQLIQTINNLTNRSFLFYIWLQIPLSILLPFIIIPLLIAFPILAPTMGLFLFLALLAIFPLIFFLITLIKIFIMLVKAYVMIILQIVIAPLQIMLDLIPGQQGFGPWIRNLIANASVFVVVPIMLVLQHLISGNFLSGALLNLTTFQNEGGVSLSLPYLGGKLEHGDILILWLVGFTIFILTPKIADMIRDALKVPAFKYGSAFGEAMGPLKPAIGGYVIPEIQQALTGPRGPFPPGTAIGNLVERGVRYAQSQKWVP